MPMSVTAARSTLAACALLSACVSTGTPDADSEETADISVISVTVPVERQTPFCSAMIELTEQLRSDDLTEDVIIDTYRSIRPDVPDVIASDFDAVLEALEQGAPPPTDPPIETVPTTPPDTTPDPSADESVEVSAEVDEGFAPGNSPAERITNHVGFACRDTQNNPGPQATQPLDDESVDES